MTFGRRWKRRKFVSKSRSPKQSFTGNSDCHVSQLQQALGFEDAKKVLQEIMVNFVGATDFAIAMVSEEGDKLLPVMAVGLTENRLPRLICRRASLAIVFNRTDRTHPIRWW